MTGTPVLSFGKRMARVRAARRSGTQAPAESASAQVEKAAPDRSAAEVAAIAKRLEDVPERMQRKIGRAHV